LELSGRAELPVTKERTIGLLLIGGLAGAVLVSQVSQSAAASDAAPVPPQTGSITGLVSVLNMPNALPGALASLGL
jgi:hypothetical protein